jgi:uncharacterized protein
MSSARPLIIDVFELARERGVVEGDLALDTLGRLVASLVRSDGALHFRICGEVDARGHPGAEMQLRADLALQCQRCNQDLEYELRRDAHFRFVASEEDLAAIPIVDDDVEVIVGSHTMAVAPWVEDEAILSLPLVPRHDECHGQYNDEAAATGAESERPHPFAVLAGLKVRRKPN